jgi:hypothetical protein
VNGSLADEKKSVPPADKALFGNAQLTGRLGDDRLVECSGMDISLATGNLIWPCLLSYFERPDFLNLIILLAAINLNI